MPESQSLDGIQRVRVLGLPLDIASMDIMAMRLADMAAGTEQSTSSYLNPHCVNLAFENQSLRAAYESFDLMLADGIGVVWAARKQDVNAPERCAITDLFPPFIELCAQRGLRVFFLGGKPGVTEKMIANLQVSFPKLVIVGHHHGYFASEESPAVVEKINAAGPQALLVGMGVPAQELWVTQNADLLRARLIWCVGGLFDFYSDSIPRAPKWMIHMNLEWMFRLMQEPGRMWRRYLIGNVKFLLRVLFSRSVK